MNDYYKSEDEEDDDEDDDDDDDVKSNCLTDEEEARSASEVTLTKDSDPVAKEVTSVVKDIEVAKGDGGEGGGVESGGGGVERAVESSKNVKECVTCGFLFVPKSKVR